MIIITKTKSMGICISTRLVLVITQEQEFVLLIARKNKYVYEKIKNLVSGPFLPKITQTTNSPKCLAQSAFGIYGPPISYNKMLEKCFASNLMKVLIDRPGNRGQWPLYDFIRPFRVTREKRRNCCKILISMYCET